MSFVKLRFIDKNRSQFFNTVRTRVDQYFEEKGISKKANALMIFKSIFYLGTFFTLYGLILSNQFSPLAMLFMALAMGAFAAFIGFNVAHDAIHGAYSSSDRVNNVMATFFNLLGANVYVWKVTHNVVHHTYTNIPGHDEDLEIAPGLIRVTEQDQLKGIHRYQHYYGFLLYCLASLSWVLRKDYMKFFKEKIGQTDNALPPKSEIFKLFFYKFVYYIMFIVVPLIVLDVTWWQFIIGFFGMHFVEGLVLGLVFQLAHLVEGTELIEANEEGNIEEAWAIHQMQTTANFASHSFMATWLCGGLNMQVEHHLFPKICHIHYPKISAIVKETALEFGVPYHENRTFLKALHSHYKVLKHYGADALAQRKFIQA
ncbi:MAG: fatty acid desaturase [Chitinophagaceae bacterium]|nr:fatty acid desaturase [Chitinophagaceae bacterium]